LYTSDTQRLYGVCHNLFNVVAPRTQDPMVDYLGKMNALFHDFNEVLPPSSTPTEEIEQRSRFFIVLTLHGLAEKYSHVHDQILGSPVIPNFTSTCFTILCVPCQPSNVIIVLANDFSTSTSQHDDHNRSRKLEKWRHKCDHCGKFGHKIDQCCALHGRPPRSAVVAQTNRPSQPSILDLPSFAFVANKSIIINEFHRWLWYLRVLRCSSFIHV